MKALTVSPSPHIHSGASTTRVMLDVVIALLPAAIAGVVIFGLKALWIILACVCSAVLAEALFNLCARKKQTIGDLSAVVTGLILALNVSTNVPIWQCVIGSVFAIIVVKCFFGGLGRNFANPAATGRVFMLMAFTGTVAGGAMPVIGQSAELVSGATPLAVMAQGTTEGLPSLLNMFLGVRGGAIGETCVLALLIGFAYLLIRKVIRWYAPVAFIVTVFVLTLIGSGFDFTFTLYQVMAGGLFIGAIFMATDYVSTPVTNCGRVLFAIGCGIVTFIIRKFLGLPEGVSISILCMNLLVPFLDRISAKVPLGGSRK